MNKKVFMPFLYNFTPFMQWLPELRNASILRADIIAGITVALVLIPQSMAYAQLAGLPAYYGLYAAFLPPIVAAIFGSSRQLATGPVAVVSLLTAAALEPIATAGGGAYVAYAILLAMFVGLFQLGLGLLRLGVLINFLSHPVVLGFTNAAAIIIATSQLSKIFGVSVEKAPHHYETVWNTLVAAASQTHWLTLGIAVLAFAIMIGSRRISPKLPGVLIAVIVTTVISWAIGFEKQRTLSVEQFAGDVARGLVAEHVALTAKIKSRQEKVATAEQRLAELKSKHGDDDRRTLKALHALDKRQLALEKESKARKTDLKELQSVHFEFVPGTGEQTGNVYLKGQLPPDAKSDGKIWTIASITDKSSVVVRTGGHIVGTIPEGLPALRMPTFEASVVGQLFFSAIAIGLIGFMEAISIAKAMAARTRQRLDANQELVGQGLSNIVGSLFQSYSVSGSFSRSAVNISAGAITGFSSVVTGLVVVVTLSFLTPLLYHLPQATLAAVIMMAVIGLVQVRALKHAWRVKRQDGVVAIVTFVLALVFAPHLDRALMIGVILSLGLYLYDTMQPRIAILSRHPDGTLRDAAVYGLETCPNISVIRFDGSLYFANTSHFEDQVLQRLTEKPDLKYVIVDGVAINEIDASGEEMLASLVQRLESAGVVLFFTRMKKQVMDVLRHSGFIDHVGPDHFFRRNELAIDTAWKALGDDHEVDCPLNIVCPVEKPEAITAGARA